jgi:hypothetical protein
MRAAVAALLAATVMATACTSGGHPAPLPSPSPSASPPPISAVAQRIRAAAARTVAGCPCRVQLGVGATGPDGKDRNLVVTGTWDPASSSGEYAVRDQRDDGSGYPPLPPPAITLRVVRGAYYVSPADTYGLARSRWARLDFTGTRRLGNVFGMLAAADPAVTFAIVASARGAVAADLRYDGFTFGDEYAAHAGAASAAARAMIAPGSPYFEVPDTRTFSEASWATNGLSVYLYEIHPHAPAVSVAAPPGAVPTVDAFTVKSLTAKRFGTI